MTSYAAYLFDLDGTIYLGDKVLPGAAETLRELRQAGGAVRFVSNNPTRRPQDYATKLNDLGVEATAAEVVTSITATTTWLLTNHPDAAVFAIGEAPLLLALSEAGISLTQDAAKVDIVLASYDRSFTYEKLQVAFDALWYYKRAFLVSTNPDKFCPYPGGRGEPDTAAIVAAIEASTGVTLQATFGKPSKQLAQLALKTLPRQVEPAQCLIVGDRLSTDIAMAHEAGMDSALVLTGDSTREEATASPFQPTRIINALPEILTMISNQS